MKILFSKTVSKETITVVETEEFFGAFTIIERGPANYGYRIDEWTGNSDVLIPIEQLVDYWVYGKEVKADPNFYFDHP